MRAREGVVQEVRVWGFIQQGRNQVGCGRNYIVLTKMGLPNEFHRFSRFPMVTPSRYRHTDHAICVLPQRMLRNGARAGIDVPSAKCAQSVQQTEREGL
jgi:hypothetical protein